MSALGWKGAGRAGAALALSVAQAAACELCPEMVPIPGGGFLMGAAPEDPEGRAAERPQRAVAIAPFALARDAVTVAEFRRFAEATGRAATGCTAAINQHGAIIFMHVAAMGWDRPGFAQGEDHPVVCVSWEDAEAYIAWVNAQSSGPPYRLPSEAEQEYVLRFEEPARAYPWGGGANEGCDAANGGDLTLREDLPDWFWGSDCRDGHRFTAPVSAFPPGPLGVRQLSGNVAEWAADCWNGTHEGAPPDGAARTEGDCGAAAVRGGAWSHGPVGLRSAFRKRLTRRQRMSDVGFRLARDRPGEGGKGRR